MPKNRAPSKQLVRRWIKKWDGQCKGKHYRPFFRVPDVPSEGRSCMIASLTTGRTHHYLSDVEYSYHLLAEYENKITDIREQYALLPWEETQEIAKHLGIKHPTYPGTKTPTVITSDIVLTSSNLTALSIKHQIDPNLSNPKVKRILEKQLIEKTYWKNRSINWKLCTKDMLPQNRVDNLDFTLACILDNNTSLSSTHTNSFVKTFIQIWLPSLTLNELIALISQKMNLSKQSVFYLFGRSIWSKQLSVDIDSNTLHHEFPVKLLLHKE